MGTDAADINNDGYIDLFTLDMLPEENKEQKLVAGPHNYAKFKQLETRGFYYQTTRNMLQLNNQGRYFTEIGQFAGVFNTNWSWSSLLCDFDNDGLKDLFITNGYGKNNTHMDVLMLLVEDAQIMQRGGQGLKDMEVVDQIPATILKNYMFRNNGDLTFDNVRKTWGFDDLTLSNGSAYADLDNDGDMDLVINNINDYAFVYRNNAETITGNHYLKINLEGSGLNTYGIGARVDIWCGKEQFTQEFMPSRGYMSSVDYGLLFGLGKAEKIDSLKVIWPDLRQQVITGVDVDQTITLNSKDAIDIRLDYPEKAPEFFRSANNKPRLNYRHRENDFLDFDRQPLLPYLLSTQGPYIAKGDINDDGLEDVFIGGASGFAGQLFIQDEDGTFEPKKMPCFEEDKKSEDLGILFFDADLDADLDLYVVSGGNSFNPNSTQLQDRLYLNEGKGKFKRADDHLPGMRTSGSSVNGADIDNDGDIDLFVGGRLVPGLYPEAPRSYILENDGRGHFTDVTRAKSSSLVNPGMVTDGLFTDFNGDGLTDLIIVGEWMPVRLFRNTGSTFEELSGQKWMEHSHGWWNRIHPADIDQDGDMDYILGNLGLNSQFKASKKEPVTLFVNDFDNNGTQDPVTCTFISGKNYPIYSKHDLTEQLKDIEVKYPTFTAYANQTVEDIFTKEMLEAGVILEANNFESSILENLGNEQFNLKTLPSEAQFSPVFSIHTEDFNSDGRLDVLLAGNFFGFRMPYGRYDANKGLLLLGNGKGDFESVPNTQSGLFIEGEVKDIAHLHAADGKDYMIFTVNSDVVQVYEYNR
jgi:hypothetical protein